MIKFLNEHTPFHYSNIYYYSERDLTLLTTHPQHPTSNITPPTYEIASLTLAMTENLKFEILNSKLQINSKFEILNPKLLVIGI